MNKVILFETELANITTPSEDRRDEEGLYNPYTIRQWQKEVPFINWTMFFNDAFKLVNRTVSMFENVLCYFFVCFFGVEATICFNQGGFESRTKDMVYPITLFDSCIWLECHKYL